MLRVTSLLTVTALVLGACSGETAAITTTSTTQPAATTTTLPPDPAVEGPVLRVGLAGGLTTANWWAAMGPESTAENQAVLAGTKPSLFALSYPGFALIPALAASTAPASATQRGSVWVVEQPMRGDVTWSDGEPVTARDLAFYFDVVREFNLGPGHAEHFPGAVTDVSAVDDVTVRVEFSTSPSVTDWQTGVAMAPLVPSHFWKPHVEAAREAAIETRSGTSDQEARAALAASSVADDDPDNDLTPETVTDEEVESHLARVAAEAGKAHLLAIESPMEPSAGSLVFESWAPGDPAVTVSNPEYFARGTETTQYSDGSVRVAAAELGDNVYGGNASGEVTGHAVVGPFISAVEWHEYADTAEAYDALQSGDVDFVFDPDGMSLSQYNELVAHGDVGLSISEGDGFRFLGFNLRKPPMSDPVFRKALATVINKDLFASTLFNGTLFPANSVIHPGIASYHNSEIAHPGFSNGEPMDEADRYEAAAAMLSDAGYTWETAPEAVFDDEGNFVDITPGVGLTLPNGVAVPELTILAAPGSVEDPMRVTFALWIEQWMTDLGMSVSTEPTDFETIIDTVVSPDSSEAATSWDLHVLGWGRPDVAMPGLTLVALFHSRNGVDVGGQNTTAYASPEFDAAADSFVASSTVEEAVRWTKEMERIVSEDLPYVPLFRDPVIEGFGSHVDFAVDAIMGGHGSVPTAWPATIRIDR
ncbi:MAG TPA: ABC transporter substrate-binding protein [Acidimicrobiia bacterium]